MTTYTGAPPPSDEAAKWLRKHVPQVLPHRGWSVFFGDYTRKFHFIPAGQFIHGEGCPCFDTLAAACEAIDARLATKSDSTSSELVPEPAASGAADWPDVGDCIDTIEAMLKAAGWDGTKQSLDATGTRPSHFIEAKLRKADALAEAARLLLVWLGCENVSGVVKPRKTYEWKELLMRCDNLRAALKDYYAESGGMKR